jgi:prepilin-type N-terminal cleavage/methylation domain-containing protein
MKNFNLLKLLKNFNLKSSNQGFTLTELLVALVMTSIILAVAAQGTASLFQSENKSNTKNTRRVELTRALAYMQNEINGAVSVDSLNCASSGISNPCLIINKPGGIIVKYAFQDISTGTQIWFKPGVLRRVQTDSSTNAPVTTNSADSPVLVDGLAIAGFSPAVPTNCPGLNTAFNGAGGFRFCVGNETPKKRVQIFLYGYAGTSATNPPIKLDMLTFAKSNP